ncbi:TIGR03792 family protein [Nostoc sp. FACHB-152]|uniref:TIGR03792 family protein n=1 Tax=unclassified Nostoc TaxID=2593658 RepID=UPI001687117A|nr:MULTISPECIES: TIGR03792 family protein [unclassified Nostoc]MBD2449240.1 TIGR03792 family protein [Nostoc sp. FACHB-152]MBD2466389.1 TIGR03792 family protein [Nostoc sp. FACHB-145]
MVIELLKFQVDPNGRENFIQKDAEIWTTALAKYPGFLGKEVWINPNNATEVVFIIRWESLEQWKAIPQVDLEAIEQKFAQTLGDIYQMVEVAEYQVRKFPHTYS